MKQINVVAAAIINDQNSILCFQRGPGRALANKWEFPGEKIEKGESEQDALVREIREELNTEIKIGEFIKEASYEYNFGRVTMRVYFATLLDGKYSLTEHLQAKWIPYSDLLSIDWAPVDIPIAEEIKRHFKL